MKKTIKTSQLEKMIAECVSQVLSEKKNKKNGPKNKAQMNEEQMREYVQKIVNEELENEGLWGRAKGAIKGLGQAFGGEVNKFKRGMMNTGLSNEYQGQSLTDRFNAAKQNVQRNAQMGDKMQDLNNLRNKLSQMIQSQVLTGEPAKLASALITSLGRSMGGVQTNLGRNFNKSYGE